MVENNDLKEIYNQEMKLAKYINMLDKDIEELKNIVIEKEKILQDLKEKNRNELKE